jgi:hypothetical protein
MGCSMGPAGAHEWSPELTDGADDGVSVVVAGLNFGRVCTLTCLELFINELCRVKGISALLSFDMDLPRPTWLCHCGVTLVIHYAEEMRRASSPACGVCK